MTLSCGMPLRFPRVADPSPQLAKAVADRIWPAIEHEWVALGGEPGVPRRDAGEADRCLPARGRPAVALDAGFRTR